MAKAFSVASWNVEHFQDDPTRIGRVVGFLKDQKPDVFALYEVEGKTVYNALTSKMPNYTFHITEGPQIQEILIGVKQGFTAFFTQKIEFKSGGSSLRPGALLTLRRGDQDYALLFLHTKSGNDPKGMGLRDDMLVRAIKFRKVLEKALGANQGNYLFLGDLNTMGMKYPFQKSIAATVELQKLDQQAKKAKMRRLPKDEPATWNNGSQSTIPPSDLDHIVAADHLKFRSFGNAEVTVRGWPKEPTSSTKDQWIREYSDHGLLYFEVQQ